MKREVTPGFICLCCVIGWWNLQIMLCFLAAVLLHEAAHRLVLYLCRVPVTGFRLCVCGAVIQTGLCSYGQEILCAAAGPLSNLVALLLFFRLSSSFAVINALLAAVNLLPLYPLDGGRILCAFLMMRVEPTQAARVMRYITAAVCCLLMLVVCWLTVAGQAGVWPIFAALILLWRVGQGKIPEQG